MRLRIILLLVLVTTSASVQAQFNKQVRDSIRSYYIEEFHEYFSVWPMLKYRSLDFAIEKKNGEGNRISFNPNGEYKLGAGFHLFELSIEVSFAIPIAIRNEELYGKSTSRDLQINMLTKAWGLDLYYQRYTGFYKNDRDNPPPPNEPFPLRPDIMTRNYGVSGFYVWNNKKFSIRSSYNFSDRQVKSAGSFIVYGTINAFSVTGDSVILSPAAQQDFGEGSDFVDLRYTTFSVAPGYSYNLVLKRFFINGTVALGPAHHWVHYRTENGTEVNDIVFNSSYTIRVGAGYSGPRFFTGAGFVLQSRVLTYQDIRFENSTSVFRLLLGYRFKEKGFLKRPIWEIFNKQA
jgi:hypothetical protein